MTLTFGVGTFATGDIGEVIYTPSAILADRLTIDSVRQDSVMTLADANTTVRFARAGVTFGAIAPNAVAGVDAVGEIETLTVDATAAVNTGNAIVTITHSGFNGGVAYNVNVPVTVGDTQAVVAASAQLALAADPAVSAFFDVTNTGTTLVLEVADATIANAAAFNVAIAGGTNNVVTSVATSVNTSRVTGIANQATQAITNGAVNSGTISVTISQTSTTLGNSTLSVNVPVVAGDTATQVATKIAAVLNANATFAARYSASDAAGTITITNDNVGVVTGMDFQIN